MSDHSIYISHAWGGESEKIVQEIYKRCRKTGLNILLDKKDLGYRESISSFMKNLGQADAIILVVSNKYLHSEYCMYELLQIYENKNMIERIFPVVLDEVSIAKSTKRLDLVKYWENETENLEAKIRELKNLSYIEGITDDLNLYQKIRNNIANMTRILKDINTLNIRLHKESDYNHLISAVENYVRKSDQEYDSGITTTGAGTSAGSTDLSAGTSPENHSSDYLNHPDKTSKKGWTGLFRMWPLLILTGLAVVIMWWFFNIGSVFMDDSVHVPEKDETIGQEHQRNVVELTPRSPEFKDNQNLAEVDTPEAIPVRKIQEYESVITPSRSKTEKPFENPTSKQSVSQELRLPPDVVPETQLSNKENKQTNSTQAIPGNESLDQHFEKPNVKHVFRMEEVFIPASTISVRISQDISSNGVQENDLIYLRSERSIVQGGVTIAAANARVIARVIDAKASHQGGRGALGIRLEGLETVDGQWLDLSYHDIVERKRGVIVFKKGTLLTDVGVDPTTVNLKIDQ